MGEIIEFKQPKDKMTTFCETLSANQLYIFGELMKDIEKEVNELKHFKINATLYIYQLEQKIKKMENKRKEN